MTNLLKIMAVISMMFMTALVFDILNERFLNQTCTVALKAMCDIDFNQSTLQKECDVRVKM